MITRSRAAALVVALAGSLVVVAAATPAYATSCTSPVKYASSSNTIYLLTPQVFTLTSIKSYCAAAPLTLVDPATKTWELSADLVLQNGATLLLDGDNAKAGPGDVNTLRLRSSSDNLATDVQNITAKWGTINADSMTLTSWDDASGGPDTNPIVSKGSPSTAQGRAFIRAISYLDTDGSSRQSTMNIDNSTFSYLGYYAGESYGVAYKAEGCDHTHVDICQRLWVTGEEVNSHFVHNYMGTYTWGANAMSFTNNEYGNNVMYGLDPHDVSRYLDIEYNHFHDNGDHGVICSQKCDHLTVEHNESDHNGMVPWSGTDPDNITDGQVHGIMFHRGVTNSTIAYNYVHDQPTGAGIAVFDCQGDSIHDNTVDGAKYGIRLSVGATQNQFYDNTVTRSTQYGVYMYKGSDLPENTNTNGHPSANVFDSNTFNSSGSNIVKLSEADGNVFSNDSFSNAGGSVLLQLSAGTAFTKSSFDSGQLFNLTGSSSEPGSAGFASILAPVKFTVDKYSTAHFTDVGGRLFNVSGKQLTTTANSTGSDLALTSAKVGTGSVTVAATAYFVLPASGTVQASGTAANGVVGITVSAVSTAQTLSLTVQGLTPGGSYVVRRRGAVLYRTTADGSGTVAFSDTPGATTSVDYTVSAS